MSRLQSYRKKRDKYRIYILIAAIVGLLVLFITFGFNFLISGSLFVNHLAGNNNNPSPEKKETFFGNLSINNIPTATNSARFIIGGSVNNFDKVEFYIENKKVMEVSVTTSDTFSEEIGDLQSGENHVYVIARSAKNKEEKKSPIYIVAYKKDKPKLEISEPSDNSKTGNTDIKVAGKTDKEVFVTVNGSPVVVDVQGNFQTSVRLSSGENNIEIIAQDEAGNEEKKELKVTYSKDE